MIKLCANYSLTYDICDFNEGTTVNKLFKTSTYLIITQKQPPCFLKKGALRIFEKFTGKHPCWRLFFNTVAYLRPATLLKKRLHHKCFYVSCAKFLITYFYRTPPVTASESYSLTFKSSISKSSHRRLCMKESVLKNFAIFTGKQLRLQHGSRPVNIAKVLRTPILKISANGCIWRSQSI